MYRTVTESTKKRVAGKQEFKCANNLNVSLKGLEKFFCPLWQISGSSKGCFNESGYEIDHIVEHSVSRNDNEDNLQALCLMCHSVKTKRFMSKSNTDKKASTNYDVSITQNIPRIEKPEWIRCIPVYSYLKVFNISSLSSLETDKLHIKNYNPHLALFQVLHCADRTITHNMFYEKKYYPRIWVNNGLSWGLLEIGLAINEVLKVQKKTFENFIKEHIYMTKEAKDHFTKYIKLSDLKNINLQDTKIEINYLHEEIEKLIISCAPTTYPRYLSTKYNGLLLLDSDSDDSESSFEKNLIKYNPKYNGSFEKYLIKYNPKKKNRKSSSEEEQTKCKSKKKKQVSELSSEEEPIKYKPKNKKKKSESSSEETPIKYKSKKKKSESSSEESVKYKSKKKKSESSEEEPVKYKSKKKKSESSSEEEPIKSKSKK